MPKQGRNLVPFNDKLRYSLENLVHLFVTLGCDVER